MLAGIRQWVLKTMMKDQTGVMRTLPKKDLVDFNVAMTAERLARGGIDPNALKNANQVENAINQIEAPRNVQQGITSTKSAKIMDMEGKQIDPRSKIMGGKQAETEAEIAARINRENKKNVGNIKNKMTEIDEAIDNASPGFAGDRKYDAQLVADDLAEKRFGKDFYDLDQRQQMDLYDEAYQGLTKKKFDPPEDMAQGGRAGFANGTGAPSITYDFDKEQEPMGPNYETNDPKEALKEIVKRMINVEPAKVPLSENMQLMFDLDRAKIGGSKDIGGGELNFGINKSFGRDDTGIGFEFRKQFKDGSGMSRRSFLKILGGLASIPILGKFLKPIKTATGIKKVPMIATDNVPGKPAWFDQLVNKVILEGDDVTKRFATQERQIVHSKDLGDGTTVRVTQDMDQGAVRVEYDSADNVFEDTVQMEYKKPLPDEGDPRPAAEFTTAESGPVGRRYGPDDYEIEVDEIGGSSISDLDSDVSKLKQYATGKGPTIREIVQNKKRKDKARRITEDPEAQSDAVVRRQGEVDESDYETLGTGDDFASGGIARMLGE